MRTSLTKWKKKVYDEYLRSNDWRLLREELFAERGKVCEECGSTKDIEVHHIHYDRIFREELRDLKVLCRRCHKDVHKESNVCDYVLTNKSHFKVNEGEDFTYFPEGLDKIEVNVFGDVYEGGVDRIYASSVNILYLNPDADVEDLRYVLLSIIRKVIGRSVTLDSFNRLFNTALAAKNDGVLEPVLSKGRWKYVTRPGVDSRTIRGIHQRSKSVKAIYECIEGWDWSKGKITQVKISKDVGISDRTVKRYWGEFKQYVKDLNKENLQK